MRLIAYATRVLFVLHSDREVEPPAEYALLHDPDGEAWPKCSLLVGAFKRARRAYDQKDVAAVDWFGKTHKLSEGDIDLPPRELSEWKALGDIEWIYYWRRGNKHRGDFKHKFGKWQPMVFWKSPGRATLYEHEKWLRVELSKGCVIDWRGIVYP